MHDNSTSSKMVLKQMELGPMMNFAYLIGCRQTKEAAVVDPAWDVEAMLKVAREENLKIKSALLTHGHPDHMNGLEALMEATDANVFMHIAERDFMVEAAALFRIPTDFVARRSAKFQLVSDGDLIRVGNLSIQCLHTPGHTPGSQCFLVEDSLISGDTLFINACGRVDLPGGDPAKMWRSLNQTLRQLPDNTILYPGHNYGNQLTSTMGEEKRKNPYMQFASVDRFVQSMSGY